MGGGRKGRGQIKDMGRGGVGREGGYRSRKVEQSVCVWRG